MKRHIQKTLIACTAALALTGCATITGHHSAWEYKVVEVNDYPGKLQAQLNELASDGWRLVSVSTTPRDQTTQVPYSCIILKRHK